MIHRRPARRGDGRQRRDAIDQIGAAIMIGIAQVLNGFMASAAAIRPWSNSCIARNVPQPGQCKPVNAWNRQTG